MEDENKNQNADTQTATDNVQENKEQKTENKNEGEKTKKQVAQKGENGEIVFKNQDELDGFIRRMYAKGAEKAEQGKTSEQIQESQTQQENTAQEESVATVDYTDKIALAMAEAGVNVKKVKRAARLVDTSKILENGTLDEKKLEDEINAVIAEFPELKNTTQEEKEEKGFKFGATESSDTSPKTKKTIPSKKWNRFNSFI